ncbi:MAG: universal stress protein [Gammaproteobacteria bacterium]|nr:universal stress protein [Gammaproteobacteria bacterium]
MAGKNVIVFPTDFSPRSKSAITWVQQMAAQLQAEVHCIYVVEEPQIYATLDMGPVPIPSIEELTNSARVRLDAYVRDSISALGIAAKGAVLVGRPSDEIVNYAGSHNAKMVIMTTHGYSGVKHLLLGSTTEAVLRHATCPVLSIRTT